MSVVLFADEAGMGVLDGLFPDPGEAIAVFDPNRFQSGLPDCYSRFEALPHPAKTDRESFMEALGTPRLGIIFSYSRILWDELLDLFPLGVVNVHFGTLPQYRGANTLQWTLINGEPSIATTLHVVDSGVDTGPVVTEQPVDILEEDTALTVREKLLAASRTMLEAWLPRLMAGPVEATPQGEALARAWPRRTPEDGRIDWTWPDERIRNLTRALVAPWPGAWFEDQAGKRIVIDRPLSLIEIQNLRREHAK